MSLAYRFPAWAEREIGSRRPAVVERWFAERGLRLSDETWRKFLRDTPPASFVLATWLAICEAAGQKLSDFVEYVPSGDPVVLRRQPQSRKATPPEPKADRAPAPPNPRDYF